MAIYAVIHLPVVGITGKGYGIYLWVLFIFVVQSDVGICAGGEFSRLRLVGKVD